MSYTLTFTGDFGPESSGATMRCQLYDSAGSASGGALTGVTELGTTGVFQYTATLADGFRGSLVMYELADATNRTGFGINPEEAENSDAKTSTRATQSSVDAIDNYIDSEVGAIKAVTDALPDAGALTTITNNVAAILADTGTDGVVLSSTTLYAIADALLKRSVSNVESAASTHSLAEIILAMLESSAPSTTWTIRKTDGTTFNTRTLTELSTALPVVGVT